MSYNEERGGSKPFFPWFSKEKKTLHNGSYEHRVPKIKTNHYSVPGMDVWVGGCLYACVIQHRTWPLRSTILNAHGTKASPDGLCTHTYIDKAFSCWFCCNSLRVARARRRNVCLSSEGMLSTLPISLSGNLKIVWSLI